MIDSYNVFSFFDAGGWDQELHLTCDITSIATANVFGDRLIQINLENGGEMFAKSSYLNVSDCISLICKRPTCSMR